MRIDLTGRSIEVVSTRKKKKICEQSFHRKTHAQGNGSTILVSISRADRLSTIMGIQLTQPWYYLGISLLHSRVSVSHFNSIVERVQSKLTGWVSDTLNLAGRTTMIQSVASTIDLWLDWWYGNGPLVDLFSWKSWLLYF